MKQISILGCGWLGLPLAKALIENGFRVNGSTTSQAKISILKQVLIHPFLIRLEEDKTAGEIHSFLNNSSVLIIDIPPKLRGNSTESFTAKIQTLIPFIEESSVEKVIFVSSTSVYADDNYEVTEETQPHPETESGKQLLEVEFLLQKNSHFQTTVVRFGGLIGEDRHPVHFLSGRKNLENPDASINLIHQKDCIGILLKIIERECWNETFNAVAPHHPTRKNYYLQKAAELGLPLPEFNQNPSSSGKIIRSEKLEKILGYQFQIPII